jgi:plasmid replication initiation protein
MKDRIINLNFTNIDKNLVTKANKLVEARYKLTATEQKIILMLISKIEPDDLDFKRYRFRITDFEKLIGVKRKNLYTEMVNITENIMKRVLKLYDVDNNKLFLTHWVQNATYELGTGYAEFTFDPSLKPYLLHLKSSFLKYQLKNVVQLKSTYSIRIYELLKQYEKIGERTFDLYELREILGLKPEEYKLYGDFKRYILKSAERELPKKTDIS